MATQIKDTVESLQNPTSPLSALKWSNAKKTAFRIAFIFFVNMSIPSRAEWYKNLFGSDWTHLHYHDLYDVARFQPEEQKASPKNKKKN